MSAWKVYLQLARQYQKSPLSEERHLIAQAKKGSQKSTEEIILRHSSKG